MRILFLGDVVGISGRSKILSSLLTEIKNKKINFVVVNGENAADAGVGITERYVKIFLIVAWTLLQQEIMYGTKKKQCLI